MSITTPSGCLESPDPGPQSGFKAYDQLSLLHLAITQGAICVRLPSSFSFKSCSSFLPVTSSVSSSGSFCPRNPPLVTRGGPAEWKSSPYISVTLPLSVYVQRCSKQTPERQGDERMGRRDQERDSVCYQTCERQAESSQIPFIRKYPAYLELFHSLAAFISCLF